MSFRLYPEQKHWCSFHDYGAIMKAAQGLQAKRVLEFGPGSSTLALIEGGAEHIDACEDNPHWESHYRERLEGRFPAHVTIHAYVWSDPPSIPSINGQYYDLAVVDGPNQTHKREAVIVYALDRCTRVLVACEDAEGPGLRGSIERLANARGRYVGYRETGPLAGSYALIGPPC